MSELSLSNGIAIELRERILRQAFLSRDKARRRISSASIGTCHRPTLGRDPMSVCLHSCSLCCLCCSGDQWLHWLCWLGDQLLHASRRGGHEASALSTQSHSAVSPERGGSPAGLPVCGDSGLLILRAATQEAGSELLSSGWQFLSSAVQEDVRSSATPQDFRSWATLVDAAVEIPHCSATMCESALSFAQLF